MSAPRGIGLSRRAFARGVCSSVLLTLAVSGLGAENSLMDGTPFGRILAAGDSRVMILGRSGEVVWEYPTKLTHDVWMLSGGNVLFADGDSVTEVTPEKKVVFQYRSAEQKGGGAYACQRLADGNTAIGENSTGRVLEVNAAGGVVFALQTAPARIGEHHNMRMARKLENGNYLVCHSGAGLVKEYTPKGDVALELKAPGSLAFAAIRTPRGTTLVSSLDQVTEFDAAGKKTWEFSRKELVGASVRNMTGMHLLPNGDLAIGCYQAYSDGQGCGLLEISREKKRVWCYHNPAGDNTMMAVEMLTPEGRALPGPCLR